MSKINLIFVLFCLCFYSFSNVKTFTDKSGSQDTYNVYFLDNVLVVEGIEPFQKIEIFSIIGNKVFTISKKSSLQKKYNFNIPNLKKSQIYIIVIYQKNKVTTYKIAA